MRSGTGRKIIYLLLGAKGSGKSFLGELIEREFGIRFVRVENWAKEVKHDRGIDDPSYHDDVFTTIEKGIRKEMIDAPSIVFESTGLTDQFDRMFFNLQNDFHVVTIRVLAPDALCLERVKTRDQSIHVNVSDDQVSAINKLVGEKNFQADFTLTNEDETPEQLKNALSNVIRKST